MASSTCRVVVVVVVLVVVVVIIKIVPEVEAARCNLVVGVVVVAVVKRLHEKVGGMRTSFLHLKSAIGALTLTRYPFKHAGVQVDPLCTVAPSMHETAAAFGMPPGALQP